MSEFGAASCASLRRCLAPAPAADYSAGTMGLETALPRGAETDLAPKNTFPRSADPRGGTRGISKMYGTPRLILTCCMAPGLSLLECPRDSPGPRVRDDPIVVRDVRGAKERPPTDVGQGRSRRASPARQAPTRGRAEAPLLPAELSAGARPKVPEGRHEWRRKWPISSTTPARSEPPRDFSATRT